MNNQFPFCVVFLAGGVGTRMNTSIPKQYLLVRNKPIALYSFEVFASLIEVERIVVVCETQHEFFFREAADEKKLRLEFACPGARRQDSVFNGIQGLEGNPLVCIHDSARPLITASVIRETVRAAESCHAAVVGVRARSTIKICDNNNKVIETLNRGLLWEIQTPQVIRLNLLKEGFLLANHNGASVTDDVSLVELLDKPVKLIEGSYSNIKVTTPEDLLFLEKMIDNYALL